MFFSSLRAGTQMEISGASAGASAGVTTMSMWYWECTQYMMPRARRKRRVETIK
jgi:hypothetical protein